ncbi:MAG: polysaccharide deacetylase family protein [Verrucomicrobiales bacterium]|jgi:peptidoglycan/xylan/chitin deacetylase (PgdA/CDA1 family)|nr:polysaccharide deacetylase family protein [Verrucomicrobiales bacterium]
MPSRVLLAKSFPRPHDVAPVTRSAFIKLMVGGALGAGAWPRLAARPSADGEPWLPVPDLPPGPHPAASPSAARFETHGPGLGSRVALTFDDGPAPGGTELVLKALDRRKLRATFFMIGRNAARHPALAAEVAAAGHEIGNHSYTHPRLDRLPANRAEAEIDRTQEAIATATGKAPAWLRPPYGGFRRKEQGPLARARDLGVVWWSVDPLDWRRPGARRIISRVVGETLPGSIILLHDIHPQTAQATGELLDRLLEQGFNFTTVSGFLGEPYGPYFG